MDYLALAIRDARTAAAPWTQQSHYFPYDARTSRRGLVQAVCGSIVYDRQFSLEPNCPACRQQKAILDAMSV